jgi:hypothetical protein
MDPGDPSETPVRSAGQVVKWLANTELNEIREEVVVTGFEILFRYLSGETEENHQRNLVVSQPKFEPVSKYKSEALRLRPACSVVYTSCNFGGKYLVRFKITHVAYR